MATTVREVRKLIRKKGDEGLPYPVIKSKSRRENGDYVVEPTRDPDIGLHIHIRTSPLDREWTESRDESLRGLARQCGRRVYESPAPHRDYVLRGEDAEIYVSGPSLRGPIDMDPEFVEDFGRIWGAETAEEIGRSPDGRPLKT